MMKRKGKLKKFLIILLVLVLLAGIGGGAWMHFGQSNAEPVYVYPFNYVGMTEYWGDSQESYGPVTTDRIQTIYLSDTQTVTEILVTQGQEVKKGDLLMTFDTTLSDLALERARLDVEKLKLQLEDAQDRLREINGMRPMVIPTYDPDEEEEENLGTALKGDYQISTQSQYDGSTQELALICWIRDDVSVDDGVLEAIRLQAEVFQKENAEKAPEETPEEIPEEATDAAPAAEDVTEEPTEGTGEGEAEPTEPAATDPQPEGPENTDPQPTEPEPEINADQFYVIFKVTRGNMSLGQVQAWQGLLVTRDPESYTYSFRFFDADGNQDHTLAQDEQPEEAPEIDFGSGFTAAQIAEMRSQQEKTIRDLEFQIKMAEADYKIMQTEVSDGNVYAEIDGVVVSLLTEEEAKMMMQPILKVSGGGGFYIEGTISELEKDKMVPGQEVTVNDWNTGMVYVGTIESIGDFPSSDGYWSGMGNPNASYYPFRVFVDGSADLQEGYYVSVMYSAGEAENGVYLENPFIRTEQGKSYVYVMGAEGTLEKRYVTTGKSLWGSYTEILDGITAEDFIAFPYGKNVEEGAPAEESDYSTLYG